MNSNRIIKNYSLHILSLILHLLFHVVLADFVYELPYSSWKGKLRKMRWSVRPWPCLANHKNRQNYKKLSNRFHWLKKARIGTYFGTINKIWVQKIVGQGLRPVAFNSRKGLKSRPPFVLHRGQHSKKPHGGFWRSMGP